MVIEVTEPVSGEARAQTLVSESIAPTFTQEPLGVPSPRQSRDTDPQCPPNSVPGLHPHSLPNPFPLCAASLSSQVYEGGSNVDQFVTRFLLKETANQIQSLLSSVESAVEAIEEQTSQIRCVDGTSRGPVGVGRVCAHLLLGGGPGSWVTLGKLLRISVPPLLQLWNGDIVYLPPHRVMTSS